MNISLDLFLYGFLFLFAWVTCFLLHELCHVVFTGKLEGKIIIAGLHMYAYPANMLMGGLGAGLIYSSVGFVLMHLGCLAVGYVFLIPGVVNICYGFFEHVYLDKWGYKKYLVGRYSIYIAVTVFMVVLWVTVLN